MLAPFKQLIYHEKDLLDLLSTLEREHATTGEATEPSAQGEGVSIESVPELTAEDLNPGSCKAMQDLRCLMGFYSSWIQPRWQYLRSPKVCEVAFIDLGLLFQPGDVIYIPRQPQKVYRVFKVTNGRPKLRQLLSDGYDGGISKLGEGDEGSTAGTANPVEWSDLELDCYFLDYDGRDVGPVHFTWAAKAWSGFQAVEKLKALPFRLVVDAAISQCRAMDSGKMFLNACKNKIFYYEGLSKPERGGKASSHGGYDRYDDRRGRSYIPIRPADPEDVASQVVIDFERCFQTNEEWEPNFTMDALAEHDDTIDDLDQTPRTYSKSSLALFASDEPDKRQHELYKSRDSWLQSPAKLSLAEFSEQCEDDLLLLPEIVVGYVLRSRSWVYLDLGQGSWRQVRPDRQGWDDLKLPKEDEKFSYKRLVEALVERHFSMQKLFAQRADMGRAFDFVEGKGRGLILLLHGPPGVGKTSTAEAIADKYGKALLPITCGGLGLAPEKVESSLTRMFQLAQAWNCIVLLDEADVFLSQRERGDLKRNALVSVFLRTLEYYTGILFVTTNRIGTLDEALRSRIHLALYYPVLDKVQTEAIWKTNLGRWQRHKELQLENQGADIIAFGVSLWDYYIKRKRVPWNGRQIRNAFQTAIALAEFERNEEFTGKPDGEAMLNLTLEHFDKVAEVSEYFEDYLKKTHKFYEADLAYERDVRADPFDLGGKSSRSEAAEGFGDAFRRRNNMYSKPHADEEYVELPFHQKLGLRRPRTLNEKEPMEAWDRDARLPEWRHSGDDPRYAARGGAPFRTASPAYDHYGRSDGLQQNDRRLPPSGQPGSSGYDERVSGFRRGRGEQPWESHADPRDAPGPRPGERNDSYNFSRSEVDNAKRE
ncbi:hypothetical protein BAUCODRAFT_187048 [Baudoinia panamericana UAMH 10762]|uniref:AAA+ ATPase domain-containing protein n=1 Tax=Baudoinia panamericana (strain UAMH 10762) TaxID=717646 RepID=M2NMU5_BAUPA|nr:uncharacterized protein BAUCODRAFT_187048 [Baudoinia panamericana UAMH 10762]EMD00860.1 hypothetical protein BAUCODRAFT_187048 [Baudoinia panamericana UAMH 10762]